MPPGKEARNILLFQCEMVTSDRVEEQNLAIILSTAIDEGQAHRARVPSRKQPIDPRYSMKCQLSQAIQTLCLRARQSIPHPQHPLDVHHALAPIVMVSAITPIGNPALSAHHRCSDMTEGTRPDRMATAVTRQARIPPSRRTNSGHRGDCFSMREKGAPRGQPPPLHVDVDQPPFDITLTRFAT